MLDGCANIVEKLCITIGKTAGLSAASTAGRFKLSFGKKLYRLKRTAFAQFLDLFTQLYSAIFIIKSLNFYPLSTGPIITTKLIKE
jgi:hypothetical protein